MQDPSSLEALQTEFDYLMARAGLTLPLERRLATLAGFVELRDQVKLLWSWPVAGEPTAIFRVRPTGRREA